MSWTDLLTLLRATGATLGIAVASIILSTLIAIPLTALAFSRFGAVRGMYRLYIWVIRGTPVLVLAMLGFYILNAGALGFGPYVSGSIVLSVYIAALFAEVFRGSVLGIPRTLWDSVRALGLPRGATFRRIVAPLVLRTALPPYVNGCIIAIKGSSVLSVIGVWELTYASREIIERNLDVFSVTAAAAAIYFVVCFSVDRAARYLEKRMALRGLVEVNT
jgi:His/Glu/Gln/Arg/opine family amino acid ABC transporter permease subunit